MSHSRFLGVPVGIMKSFTLLLLLITSFRLASGRNPKHRHIYGGQETQINKFPWVITLQMSEPGRTPDTCGGALISIGDEKRSDIILTAAHCVAKFECEDEKAKTNCAWNLRDADSITVVAGNQFLKETDQTEQSLEATKVEYYPEWKNLDMNQCIDDLVPASACHTHDMALIKVRGSGFTFTKAIRAIQLPERDEPVVNPTKCAVAGWGVFVEVDDNDETGKEVSVASSRESSRPCFVPARWVFTLLAIKRVKLSDDLRSLDVTVLDQAECAKDNKESSEKFANLLCAVAGGRNGNGSSCAGDSGGPLSCANMDDKPTIYGVISGSSGICGPTLISVYVNVAKYVDWIEEFIKRESFKYAKQG